MTDRIGIYGGTFDPVHLGHIHAANAVAEEFSLDRISLVPVSQPVHRDNPGASSEQRMAMLNLAISDSQLLHLDDREILRGGPSYSLLTVQEYRRENPSAQLFFMLGTDAFNDLASWYCWQEIFDYVNLIVMARPDIELAIKGAAASFLSDRITYEYDKSTHLTRGKVYLSKEAMIDNSATQVRRAIINNQSLTEIVDKKVVSFIKENNIYRKDLLK